MSARYTQSKAETQKHLEILKGMLRRPENKLCADCKRNDPRWASTNLGCFMCIRCSGIHRGMGVHITRIKSVDLDTWTPEQIENVQKWGNKRANLYWEAHLKPGHQPPEHKMESFIRSKYELKRWASQGPPPADPSVLERGEGNNDDVSSVPAPSAAPTSSRKSASSSPSVDLFSSTPPPPASSSSSSRRTTSSVPSKSSAAPPAASTSNSLFDLDFDSPPSYNNSSRPAPPSQAPTPSAPSPAPAPAPVKRDAKADILSLFSVAPPPRPVQAVPHQQQQQQQASSTSSGMGGLNAGLSGLSFGDDNSFGGAGGWGTSTTQTSSAPPPVPAVHNNGFGNFSSPAPAPPSHDPFSGTTSSASIWGNPSSTSASPPSSKPATTTNDPFAEFGAFTTGGSSGARSGGGSSNIWGDSGTTGNGGNGASEAGGFSDIWA
ncbi:stromal membrane-associated family protein [Sporobolomyces salmoneus]|uniref:stromal membrane-associated family protein n=1 Tax=Sporobolomyces salmoneus TaxID=183962 RepID=UPI00317D0E90